MLITFSISMYIMCVILCLFSALSRRVDALQISINYYYYDYYAGGLNNTEQEYRNGIAKHMPGDRHHLMTYYRNVYIVLANDVLQP